jgi:methylated-DNA-[protein]-cysteine S-methyltransferase
MNHINIQQLKTPCGELILGSHNKQLCLCDWRSRKKRDSIDSRLKNELMAEFIEKDDLLLLETRRQLKEYFHHQRQIFDIPLLMVGTTFQKKVWNQLLKIPFGTTSSYQQLAQDISNKNAVRAVANANAANAISIIIPCHRAIGSNGKLTGYAGGLRAKAALLSLELEFFN